MPPPEDPKVEHSKPLSASRSVKWGLLKVNDKERVKRVLDRMKPVINIQEPPTDRKKIKEMAGLLAKPIYPTGFTADYPQRNEWVNYELKTLTTSIPDRARGMPATETRMTWVSARDPEWRRKHWGTRANSNKSKNKDGSPKAPQEVVGQESRDRWHNVLKSAIAYFCHLNAPDPDLKEGFPWIRESTSLAKEVVRYEFAGRPDQYDYHASYRGRLYVKLYWTWSEHIRETALARPSPEWALRFQFGVIGNEWYCSRPSDRNESHRPKIAYVAHTMVNEPPRAIDQSAMSATGPMGYPRVEIDLTEWEKAYPTPTAKEVADRDRQVSWMVYAYYMCAPFQRCSIEEYRRQFRQIIEKSRKWEDNRTIGGTEIPLFILQVSRTTREREILLSAELDASNDLMGTKVHTGIFLPQEAEHDHCYRTVFRECIDIWQTTRNGSLVMDTLVLMLDYLQGYDVGAEHWLNMFHCPHFHKDGSHPCLAGCGNVLSCGEVEEQQGLSMCCDCQVPKATSSFRSSSWPSLAAVAKETGNNFPVQFHSELARAVGNQAYRVGKLKDSLNSLSSVNFGVAGVPAMLRALGKQVVKGRPVDASCVGNQRGIQLSRNPMMRLILSKPLRIHQADEPLCTYLWHQDVVTMSRSAFGRLKYTHSGYTLKQLINAIGMTQSHDANLPIPCQLRLKEIESNLHHAWKLEKKLPHVLNALVSADPKSYQDTLSKMATLDNKNPEADADGTAETDLPLAQRNIDQVIFIDNIPTKAKGDRELAVALKIINEWEAKSPHKHVLPRSAAGWPYPFEHECAQSRRWDHVSLTAWFQRALTTLRTKCNKTDAELNPMTMYLLSCYWTILYDGRCHFSGLRFSPFPRHPCRMSLGKRVHGSPMTCGWNTGSPTSAGDFDPDMCNIHPEIWPVNAFKWQYSRNDIESFVFEIIVPEARVLHNQVMGRNNSLPPSKYQASASTSTTQAQVVVDDAISDASSDLSDAPDPTVRQFAESSQMAITRSSLRPAKASEMIDLTFSSDEEAGTDEKDLVSENIVGNGDDLIKVVTATAVQLNAKSHSELQVLDKLWYTAERGSDEELSAILEIVGSCV